MQKRLDAEAKQLHSHASNFARQTQQWLGLVDNFNSSLKELGDVDSWARSGRAEQERIDRNSTSNAYPDYLNNCQNI